MIRFFDDIGRYINRLALSITIFNITPSFSKLRKRYSNKKWLLKYYNWALDKDEDLKEFKTFECSKFFRSKKKAKANKKIYKRYKKRLEWKTNFIENQMQKLKISYTEEILSKI